MHIVEDYPGVEYVVVSHAMQLWPTASIDSGRADLDPSTLQVLVKAADQARIGESQRVMGPDTHVVLRIGVRSELATALGPAPILGGGNQRPADSTNQPSRYATRSLTHPSA